MRYKKEKMFLMKKNQTVFLKLCLADALITLMKKQAYNTINVSAVCELAGIGRTTFYRHLDNKSGKEELLIFKINYDWEKYAEEHSEEVEKDKGFALLKYVYENRRLFTLLNKNGLVTTIMCVFEKLILSDEPIDKESSYIMSFFTYGYFGVIYQWIKYDFDETPEEVQKHIIVKATPHNVSKK